MVITWCQAGQDWLKEQSELFYFTGIKNSKIAIHCAFTKAVIMLNNKRILAQLSFVYIG